jgi:hypothetical protein
MNDIRCSTHMIWTLSSQSSRKPYKVISTLNSLDINEMDDNEVKYQYLDHKLYKNNIFHEFFFQTLKNAKPTGEYRIIGVILHKGDYYHHPDESHKHDCRGEFQVIIYKKHRTWIKIHKANVEYVDVDEVTNSKYWGKEGDWTPVLFMYREIKMKNVKIDQSAQDNVNKNKKVQEVNEKEKKQKAP